MYRVIDPVPVDAGAPFMRQLADSAFMPNAEAMMELATELGSIGGERFLQFVIKLIDLIGTKMLEEFLPIVDAARAQIQQWYDDTRQALEELQQQIGPAGGGDRAPRHRGRARLRPGRSTTC